MEIEEVLGLVGVIGLPVVFLVLVGVVIRRIVVSIRQRLVHSPSSSCVQSTEGASIVGRYMGDIPNGCLALDDIELPDGYLAGAENLKQVVINCNGNAAVQTACFSACIGLEKVEWKNDADDADLAAIYECAFKECTALRAFSFPRSIRYVGQFAFESSGLESVTLNEGLVMIDNWAFELCGLKQIDFPKSLTYIGRYAFDSCECLSNVHFSSGLRTIGASAFEDCGSLSVVLIPQNVKYIGVNAFSSEAPLEVSFAGVKPESGYEKELDEETGDEVEKGIFGDFGTAKDRVKVWFRKGAKGWVDGETWNGVVVHEKPE